MTRTRYISNSEQTHGYLTYATQDFVFASPDARLVAEYYGLPEDPLAYALDHETRINLYAVFWIVQNLWESYSNIPGSLESPARNGISCMPNIRLLTHYNYYCE